VIAIAFRFLAGRYHATPWGHHVNEGLVEWPPSPYRLLRALVATHYRDPERLPEPLVRSTLLQIGGLPLYALPATTEGHTRHYMPVDGGARTLVFDAFVATDGGAGGLARPDGQGELVAVWPDAELAADERRVLTELCHRVGYLGRAESWAEARLLDGYDGPIHARPARADGAEDDRDRNVRLLALLDVNEYAAWRAGFMEGQRREKKRVEPPLDLWGVLGSDIALIQKEGWRVPPGTRWIAYRVAPTDLARNVRRSSVTALELPTFARFAIASRVLPRLSTALSVAERLRATLVKCSNGSPVFAGHESDGAALQGHQHAFYLPTDDDGDGRIDHVAVWADGGFDEYAISALQKVRRVWGSEGHDLHLVLIGLGRPEDYGGHTRGGAATAIAGTSRRWRSVTPFILTRHPKRRRGAWQDTAEDQVRRACEQLVGVAPAEVGRTTGDERPNAWRGFYLQRKRGSGARASNQPYGFRLSFDVPVTGPIALGYGAHFGLGQFVAIADES